MSEWKPDICIYHGGCDDGFGAALGVHARWGNQVAYVPGVYSKPIDVDTAGKRLLFVDFSLKQDAMRSLARSAQSIVVLDHHKTAEAELYPWSIGGKGTPALDLRGKGTGQSALGRVDELLAMNEIENVEPVVAFFDMHKSGARMTWEFCHPSYDVPRLIQYIEDRDLWRFAMRETKTVSAALRTYPHDFDLWHGFVADSSRLIQEGSAVLRGHEKNVQAFISNRYWGEIGGVSVPIVNVPYHYASDCADAMLDAEPSAPFCASWFRLADGRNQFSLRSRDDRMDVSEIAKKFGGGGHRNAAGFERVVIEEAV